jgi:hypothetical protein
MKSVKFRVRRIGNTPIRTESGSTYPEKFRLPRIHSAEPEK